MVHIRRLARQALLASILLAILGAALAVPGAQVARAWSAGAFSSADESLLFSLTNQARAAAGLAPLRWDAQLASIARWRVQDMSTRDYFSHQIPPQGYLVFHYMDQQGVSYVLAGENIGWVSNIADDAATPWIQQQFMNSPEHRSNILGTKWDSAGVGAYKGADGKFLYCVLFKESEPTATPKPTATLTQTPRPTPDTTPHPVSTPRPAPIATRAPTAAPTETPTPTAGPTDRPTVAPPSLTPLVSPAATASPETLPASPPGQPLSSQRVVNDAPAPGLLESLISAIFGIGGPI